LQVPEVQEKLQIGRIGNETRHHAVAAEDSERESLMVGEAVGHDRSPAINRLADSTAFYPSEISA